MFVPGKGQLWAHMWPPGSHRLAQLFSIWPWLQFLARKVTLVAWKIEIFLLTCSNAWLPSPLLTLASTSCKGASLHFPWALPAGISGPVLAVLGACRVHFLAQHGHRPPQAQGPAVASEHTHFPLKFTVIQSQASDSQLQWPPLLASC